MSISICDNIQIPKFNNNNNIILNKMQFLEVELELISCILRQKKCLQGKDVFAKNAKFYLYRSVI